MTDLACSCSFSLSYLSWLAFLYPFMLDIPALRTALEQLWECLRVWADSSPGSWRGREGISPRYVPKCIPPRGHQEKGLSPQNPMASFPFAL